MASNTTAYSFGVTGKPNLFKNSLYDYKLPFEFKSSLTQYHFHTNFYRREIYFLLNTSIIPNNIFIW